MSNDTWTLILLLAAVFGALAAIAAGADGLMIEVHNDPEKALCDGAQSLTPQMFDALMKKIQRTVDFFRILD